MEQVVIYTTATCCYCERAKAWLTERGIPYREVDLTDDDEGRRHLVERAGGQRTVPQIFVGDVHIGGCTDLVALDRAGGFTPLLTPKGA